jgi:membrane associated rhomboid family serine protease
MTRWVSRLIFANVVVWILCLAMPGLRDILAFFPAGVLSAPWTPITYMFVHAPGLWHIGFNMLSLYFFGPRLEARLGSENFIALYLLSGLGGAVLSFYNPHTPIIGASGAVFGVFFGYARCWPHDRILIWGIIPVETRVLVLVTTLYAIWGGLGSVGGGIAHFAHLGGYLGGFLYMAWLEKRSPTRQYRKRLETAMYGEKSVLASDVPQWDAIRRDGLHPLNLEEIDRLAEKVRVHGNGSLTPDERAFLHRMSSR